MTNEQYKNVLLLARESQWQYKLDQYTDEALKSILKSVEQARREVINKLKSASLKYGSYTHERAIKLLDELEYLTLGVKSKIAKDVADVASLAGSAAYANYNDTLSFGGIVGDFNAVHVSAERLMAMVSTVPVGGYQLNEWVNRAFEKHLIDDIKTEITTGMLKGESYRDLVKRVRYGFDRTRTEAITLTRSYVQTINAQASLDVATSNQDLVKGWKWSSANENGFAWTKSGNGVGRGICVRCLALGSSDKLYKLDEGPPLPLHPRCRCSRLYITRSWKELGANVDDVPESYKPFSIRGKISKRTGDITPQRVDTGGREIINAGVFEGGYENGLFEKLSYEMKKQTIGPRRLELYEAGKIHLKDLVEPKTGRLYRINELI